MKSRLKLIAPPAEQPAKPPPILEIEELGRVFRAGASFLTVLEGIRLEVAAGEMICLLGPSGCGKTTLLKILAGFLPPSSGKVCLHGRPVGRPAPDRCVVFQEDALFPWLTVSENIGFGLKGKGIPRRRRREMVVRYLELVGLTAFARYLPHEISGGMKQRVALARVLILEPEILLMDEPFAALDAQTREEMQQLLLRLWHSLRQTIVFVTHDVREAVTLADRVVVMERSPGRVRKVVSIRLVRPRDIDAASLHRCCARLHELLRGR